MSKNVDEGPFLLPGSKGLCVTFLSTIEGGKYAITI